MIRRGSRAFTLALAVGLLAAAPAQATFHLIKVREVYPGPGDRTGFVELQMYEEGQSHLEGHILTVYDASGEPIHTATFAHGVARGANQSTILVGEEDVGTTLGVAPDLVDPGLDLPAAGGAVCWNSDGSPSDCVSWGDFAGNAKLSSPAGAPAAPGGLGPEQAILRRISPGCPTFLEPGDDTDDSATDFAVLDGSPNPRDNATPPTETPCPGMPPDTSIDDRPALHSSSPSASFTYGAATATAFKCKLDSAPFGSCPATGRTLNNLADGTHTFQVFGENAAGQDPTPASFTWSVDTVAPTSTIDAHPGALSPGQAATFAFHASEATQRFECSLNGRGGPVAFAPCASPRTFAGLVAGAYAFGVRAIDLAGNVEPVPAVYTFSVGMEPTPTPEQPLAPPQTSLLGRPPRRIADRTPTFRFRADLAGASFRCALDRGRFRPCRSPFTTPPLRPGRHTFAVEAVLGGQADPTPARAAFLVLGRGAR